MNKPTFTKEPCIHHCCRQDENGELVDKGEHSETDVTLAVVSNGEVQCMECGNNLLNDRLIASAPEMLSILQDILVKCPVNGYRGKYDYGKTYQARKRAREILAKVEGEK